MADTLRDKPKAEFKFNGADSHRAGRREAAYAEAALSNCAAELAAKGVPGRNILLNNCALKMGHMIASGWIGRATVEGRLIDACKTNGYVQSDGERAAWATIASGINDGFLQPHPPLVDRPFEPRAQPKGNGQGPPSRDNARDWSDPDWSILDDRRGVLPEFPLDALSDKLQKTIERTAKGAGVTPAHVAVPLIGVVSSLIGTARRVRATSSWLPCTTCWTVVVGFSGTGKTPGINVTKRALNFLERNSKTADDERRRKHETKQEIASATRKCWEKNVKDAIEARMPAPPMPAEEPRAG